MNDLFNVFQAILAALKQPLTPWLVIVFILLFVLRDRIKKLIDTFLDWLGTKFETDVGYRRFEPRYRDIIRQNHLYLKIVGIRTEEERRPKITDAYVPIKLVPRGGSLDQALLIEQTTRDTPYSLILGDPGAGKSTLLDYLTIEHTRPLASASAKSRFGLASLLKPLKRRILSPCPIYISLRRCSPANRTLLEDILDPNTEILPQAVHEQMSKNFIRRSVERGRAVLLLDGLDEVTSEDVYRTVIKKVNDFIQRYKDNKVVVTCRKVGWKGGLDFFQVFTALPLDAQQQHDFVHKWYAAILEYTQFGRSIGGSEKNEAEQEANKLLGLLRFKERLRELASNPLMLALICLVHRQRKDLPRGRADLYKDCVDILLGLWDRIDKKGIYQQFPTTEQKKLLLRNIAFDMHSRGVKEESRQKLEALALQFLPGMIENNIQPAELVRQIEERSGLLVERSIDRLAFAHLTLQEFLVVEYCRVEQKENMNLTAISDWSAWREPVLLMCGVITDPNTFLAQLFAIQPIIAIEGLVEAEPTRLDTHLAERMVDTFIEKIKQGSVDIDQAIPTLVNLLSMEKNPFGQKIVTYIYTSIQQLKSEEISRLVEAVSKTPTRESARIILTLLTKFDLRTLPSQSQAILLSGLTRVGDPAMEETLAWERRKELTEEQVFSILLDSLTPFATKILWERYQIQPPLGYEVAWAKAWAIRLASKENDQVIRTIPQLMNSAVEDPVVWPYRQNDKSALARLVKKVVDILCSYYEQAVKLEDEKDIIAKFALRIQIVLGINIQNIRKYIFKIDNDQDIQNFNTHSWYTLGSFFARTRQTSKSPLRVISLYVGLVIEFLSIILVDWGIITLLPPNGNLISFWFWLSLDWRIALIIVYSIMIVLVANFSYLINIDKTQRYKIDELLVGIIVGILVMLFPTLLYYKYIWSDQSVTIEETMSLRKVRWKPILYVLIGIILSGLAGFFVLKSRLGVLPGVICAVAISALVLLGIFMNERAMAFRKNPMAEWLQKHPKGREVLDEFAS
jgi:hypothetical protein